MYIMFALETSLFKLLSYASGISSRLDTAMCIYVVICCASIWRGESSEIAVNAGRSLE